MRIFIRSTAIFVWVESIFLKAETVVVLGTQKPNCFGGDGRRYTTLKINKGINFAIRIVFLLLHLRGT